MVVYAVFHGYSGTLKGVRAKYTEDEWLCGLYQTMADARDVLWDFAKGKEEPIFDNPPREQGDPVL